jgi:hypothetical protein
MSDDQTRWVLLWWTILSAVSLFNITIWLLLATGLRRGRAARAGAVFSTRGCQTVLAALFVFGCAFRSFLPRVEAMRFCLYDSGWSAATLGRAVATVAELAFVAQWALVLKEWCRVAGSPHGQRVARLLLPLIAVAEGCSWYSALTTNFLGSVFEESLWALNGGLVTWILAVLWVRAQGSRERFLGTILVMTSAYVLFMCTVDVPMYYRRWKEDQAARRPYFSLREGWRDALTRRIVTRRWQDWHDEVPWMSLYFSGGVWLSLALMRAPRLEVERAPEESGDD